MATRGTSVPFERTLGVALILACMAAMLVATASPAAAVVFSNTAPITVPDANCDGTPGKATPYPSNIAVSGLTGTLADVNVTLTGVTHAFEGDLEVLLVGPAGGSQNLEILSDAGTGGLSNATVTFDDAAASLAPQNTGWPPGTYKPSNYTELSGVDVFPAPAPTPNSMNTTLGAFTGIAPNGTWSLYVIDDACPDPGSISGGWSLSITTSVAPPTSTSVISSLNPSRTGQSVTFTSTTTSSGSPVPTGTVTFTEGAVTLAANVAVNASGQAAFTTSSLPEGNHVITATYNGNASFATSNGFVNQRIDNNTTVNGSTYCNTGAIAITDNGPSTPYPSNIFVTGGAGITKVTATLKNITHGFDGDVEAMLVSPAGANVVVVSDAGTAGVTNITLVLDDAAAGLLPQAGAWGAGNSTLTVKPTNYTEATPDVFPAPAPAPSMNTLMSTFNGVNANGTWSLYVKDDGAPDTGSMAGGWCLNFTFDLTPPTVTINQAAGQADPATIAPVNFTATFSEAVTGFTGPDVAFAGSTAGGTLAAVVTGGPTVYNVAVSGMTTSGSVVATIPAGRATDTAGNGNTGSTSTDNSVVWKRVVKPPANFDGDVDTDRSVYRPSAGDWFVLNGGAVQTTFGTAGDIPVPADYDGNGTIDKAVYRPSTGQWFVLGGNPSVVTFGTGSDIPVPADYDGNGTADKAVFRPSTGQWFVLGGNPALVAWGASTDVPVPGDYDGDGDADVAVYRPSTGVWYVAGGAPAGVAFGSGGDIPVPGDYNGNGNVDMAVFRPSTGGWYVLGGTPLLTTWGASGDMPVPGDFDGDGDADKAVYRPTTGQWYVLGGSPQEVVFGAGADVPLPLPYAIRRAYF